MPSSNIKIFFDFWAIADRLKRVKRWKGVPQMKRKESAADHSWQLAALTFVAQKELDIKVDLFRSIQLALVHDLVEAITGDIDSVLIHSGEADKTHKKKLERKAIKLLSKSLPKKSGEEIENLWNEYEKRSSREAKLVYALDKLESVIHMTNCGYKSFHQHDDFIAPYCHAPIKNFPELKPLHFVVQEKLKKEYIKKGWAWRKEYDVEPISAESRERAETICRFACLGEKLKLTKRYGTVKEMPVKESAADHSWNLALASFILISVLNLKLNELESVKLALFHDLPEALTGDIDYSLIYFGLKQKQHKEDGENEAIKKIAKLLGERSGKEIFEIWKEYQSSTTNEAKFIKALDKIEGINHLLVLGHRRFDHPELIAPYPNLATRRFLPLIPVLRELQQRLRPLYKKLGWEWRSEYLV